MIYKTNLIFTVCLLLSYSIPQNTYAQNKIPFSLEVVRGSREVIMVQEHPWEEQMMGYFKVLKTGRKNWQMWYSTWDNNRVSDYSNFLTYAHSKDGKNWIKSIPGSPNNILRGSGHPRLDGIVEQDVIIDKSSPLKYKMIYTACDPLDNNREKTFLEESADGINWTNKRILWNRKFDSQFSVIERNEQFHIYLRSWGVYNGKRYRTIGLAITDKDWNIISEPVQIFKADFESEYPHLYNPAASKISDHLDILFPTYYDDKNDKIKICIAYMFQGYGVLTDIDITKELLAGEHDNWAIAMPGLVKEGRNTYWLYYYSSNMLHNNHLQKSREFKYYRIKLKVKK